MTDWPSNQEEEQSDELSDVTLSIEEARRNQTDYLSFANNQLTELPESVGQLTQLKSLDLDNNQLTELPESVGLTDYISKARNFARTLA